MEAEKVAYDANEKITNKYQHYEVTTLDDIFYEIYEQGQSAAY